MNWLINGLAKMRLFEGDVDYHLVWASMVIIYFFFGYQKWFDYEVQGLIPFFKHGPLIFWMYQVFGMKGSTYLLGLSEWLFGALLLAGFWNKKLGIWARSDRWLHFSALSRSSRSCRMAGHLRRADFPRW